MPRDRIALLDAPPDLTTPSLEGLGWLLRHKEAWPEGFEWGFQKCNTCAVGLAYCMIEGKLASADFNPNDAVIWLPRKFPVLCDNDGYLRAGGSEIFFGDLAAKLRKCLDEVQPHDVADAIDAYLATR